MPYPASPPEPNALVTTPVSEEIRYANASTAASNVARDRVVNQDSPVVIALPETTPSATDLPTAADFVPQVSGSQAALLGPSITTGYLLKDTPPAQVFKAVPPTPDQKQPATDTLMSDRLRPVEPRQRFGRAGLQPAANGVPPAIVPNRANTSPPAAPSATPEPSQPVVYSLSGAATPSGTTSAPAGAVESAVMSGLNQAIVLDEFAQETLAQEESGTADKPGLSIHAQAPGTAPILLPIPTLEQPQDQPLDQAPANGTPPTTPVDQPSAQPGTGNSPPASKSGPSTTAPSGTGNVPGVGSIIELTADRQEYDEQRRIFTAEGRVLMRFQGALLDADRLQVNLDNRLAVAEGNVALTRGNQVLRGQRLEYNFVQGIGTVLNARGEILIPNSGRDLAIGARGDNEGVTIPRPVSDRVTAAQPTQNVTSPGSLGLGIGFGRDISRVPGGVPQGGQIRRLRFEAERIDFTPDGWLATNIQITNDPFSPPELVLKADRAKFTRVSPLVDKIRTTHPRLVFDQRVTLPIFVPVITLDRHQRSPALLSFGYDDADRGGLFVERTFDVLSSDTVRFTLTPQIFLQRAITNNNGFFRPENFGFRAGLRIDPGPLTTIRGKLSLTSLDFTDAENNLRVNLRANQQLGTHTLVLEYNYRDRLFNGSLGFQTVQSSLGAVLLSPRILLGQTGIELTYQTSFQYVNADTDRPDLLAPDRTNNRINLGRFQATAQLARGFTLWQGHPLPPTITEGLRYSPVPLTPYLNLGVTLRGIVNAYTNGDTQQNLVVTAGLSGQFGHFARDFLDYTAFNISYIQYIGSGQSPFLFDRTVDNRILSFGVTQQLYGPIRIGFQTSINLDTSNQISTDYILEYSRRTYAIVLRYNPVLALGAIGIRISDFNWTGGTDTFEGADVTPVEGGVILRREE